MSEMNRRRLLQAAAAASAFAGVIARAEVANADDERAIEALLARMTLEEKAGQLTLLPDNARAGALAGANPAQQNQTNDTLTEIRAGRIGGLFNGVGAAGGRALQRAAVEDSRLKIPLIFGADIIHGYQTIFPIPLGEASSFEPELAERTARAAAMEASAAGLHWTFAPMVDVARDQRWGRVAEGAGEDPYLGAHFAAARVRGFHGRDIRAADSLLACPKHFAAYGAVAGGMEYSTADIPEQTLRDVHLPPFKAAFDAGALTTMSSFNDIAGVPATANHHLLTDILRDEWGFRGFVVSDYTADEELIAHGYAADGPDAARLSLLAGMDMSMTSGFYMRFLPDLVRNGAVPQHILDESVRRILRIKTRIGLFDNPYRGCDPARERRVMGLRPTLALAREAARKSVVLLKNEGDLLPLQRSARVALIGPFVAGDENQEGPWAFLGTQHDAASIANGIAGALGDASRLTVVKGCNVEQPIAGGVDAAVAAARGADVVIMVVGEGANMSGEAQSRVEIVAPQAQQDLVEAVAATGKPMVVLLRHGRALALHGAVKNARAIMATWFLGSETGVALADILFGAYAPSGRLTVSFPQESGQEPFFYNHRSGGRPQTTEDAEYKSRYREVTNEPLFAFGHGLTYTKFEYGPVQLSGDAMAWDGELTATATVRNTGSRAGEEVVQFYIHDRVASITQPVRKLKGYNKITLAPGETKTVSFTLKRADLEFTGPEMVRNAEPGTFDVWISPSAVTGEAKSFELRR
ncbi:MAG: glycoside hydrolase family 3 N-terminal domain-containing protein [Terricaulis silvestris]